MSFIVIRSVPQLLRCNNVVKGRPRRGLKIGERPRQAKHPVDPPHGRVTGIDEPIKLMNKRGIDA